MRPTDLATVTTFSDRPQTAFRPQLAVGFGVPIVVALVALAEANRLIAPESDGEVLAGVDGYRRLLPALLSVLAGGLVLTVLSLWRTQGRKAMGFGVVAAASIVSLLLPALLAVPIVAVWLTARELLQTLVVTVGALLAILLAPRLRDRGLASLLWVSLLASVLLVVARRAGIQQAEQASVRLSVVSHVVDQGMAEVFVRIDPDLPLWTRRAAVLEARRLGVHLFCVEADRDAAALLYRSGKVIVSMPGLERLPEGTALPPPALTDAVALWRPEVGPTVVVRKAEGPYTLDVVTPVGHVRHTVQDPVLGIILVGAAQERLREMLIGLPPDSVVYLVVHDALGLASGWLSLPIEP